MTQLLKAKQTLHSLSTISQGLCMKDIWFISANKLVKCFLMNSFNPGITRKVPMSDFVTRFHWKLTSMTSFNVPLPFSLHLSCKVHWLIRLRAIKDALLFITWSRCSYLPGVDHVMAKACLGRKSSVQALEVGPELWMSHRLCGISFCCGVRQWIFLFWGFHVCFQRLDNWPFSPCFALTILFARGLHKHRLYKMNKFKLGVFYNLLFLPPHTRMLGHLLLSKEAQREWQKISVAKFWRCR